MSGTDLSRTAAASLLNDARRERGPGRHALAGWAATVLPDSRAAVRLHTRSLIETDDLPAAAALLARAQLQRPGDASLAVLRAEVLLRLDRPDDAETELARVRPRRASHGATIELSGDVATARHRPADAARYYEQALSTPPGRHGRIRDKLVMALLACGRIDGAARVVRPESPLLRARVLRAQGRLLEAADRLTQAIDDGPPTASADDLHAELIDTLLTQGDVSRLARLLAEPSPILAGPRATARAGRALLGLGEFDRAATIVASIARGGHREALHVLVVAAALDGRRGLSRRALDRLGRTRGGIDRMLMADCWRLGTGGQLLDCSGRTGTDRSPSLLEPLLRGAVRTFAASLEDPAEDLDREEIGRHRAICEAALAA